MNDNQKITIDYIVSNTELNYEDFEGVDFDEFVEMYDLTVQDVHEYHIPDLLAMYKSEKEREDGTDYSYIFSDGNESITESDYEAIDIMLWEYHEGVENIYMVMDFASNKVYYSANSDDIISFCTESFKIANLNEDDKAFILNALSESNIVNWKKRYEGTNENTTGHLSWSVGFKLNNDKCISYSANGVYNSDSPPEFNALVNALSKHFVG